MLVVKRKTMLFAAVFAVFSALSFYRTSIGRKSRGRSLSIWLEQMRTGADSQTQKAEEAVRSIGPAAVPFIIRKLEARDSRLKENAIVAAEKFGFLRSFKFKTAKEHREEAIRAIRALGPVAKPAIPALTELLQKDATAPQGVAGLSAQTDRGEMLLVPESIPSLLRAATNRNRNVRATAVNALGLAQTNSSLTLPALINALDDPDLQFAPTLPVHLVVFTNNTPRTSCRF